jgi:hypothetical protein
MNRWLRRVFTPTILVYIGIVAAALILAVVIIGLAIRAQGTVTPQDKQIALSNCVSWVGEHTKAPNPVVRCVDARRDDPTSFYLRWAPTS